MIKCAKHGSFSGEKGSYLVIFFYICTLFGIKLEKMREESLQNHVIATAQKLFYKEGVRAVTMDKVAQSLRMSKRTALRVVYRQGRSSRGLCRSFSQGF